MHSLRIIFVIFIDVFYLEWSKKLSELGPCAITNEDGVEEILVPMLDAVVIVIANSFSHVDETEDDVCCSVSTTNNFDVCRQGLCFCWRNEAIILIKDYDVDNEGNIVGT